MQERGIEERHAFPVSPRSAHPSRLRAAARALTVRVCDSLSCALGGGEQLLEDLRDRLGDGVRVVRAPCMGGCDKAPVVAIGHALHEHATKDSVAAAVAAGDTHPALPAYPGLDQYRAGGGYGLLQSRL